MTQQFPILPAQRVAEALGAGGLVLLNFWQAPCPPCRALEPRLDAFAARHPRAFTGYRIDVDADQATPARFDVMSIPTLVLLRDGAELARLDGLIRDADLEGLLTAAVDSPQKPPGHDEG